MIRNTHKKTPDYTVSAYSDNAAVLEGASANFWAPDYSTGSWKLTKETVHILAKVETHNHPTAIAPFPGAATGSGVSTLCGEPCPLGIDTDESYPGRTS
jgi:phosphoribosylformylglycinamidine synthase